MTLFGFRTGTFRGWPVEQSAARLAWLGYDCVELCLEAPDVRPEYLSESRCREIRRRLDDVGIGLASVSYHGDAESPPQRRANQQRAIGVCRWLGSPILVLNAERTVDRARQWSEHVQHWRELCQLGRTITGDAGYRARAATGSGQQYGHGSDDPGCRLQVAGG